MDEDRYRLSWRLLVSMAALALPSVSLGGTGGLPLCEGLLCDASHAARAAKDLGLDRLELSAPDGEVSYRVVGMGPWGATLPALTFTRSAPGDMALEVRAPTDAGAPRVLTRTIATPLWARLEARYRRLTDEVRRERAKRRPGERLFVQCLDGVSYQIDASAEGRRKTYSSAGCHDSGDRAANDMARIALEALAPCAPTPGGAPWNDLNRCLGLPPVGDRIGS